MTRWIFFCGFSFIWFFFMFYNRDLLWSSSLLPGVGTARLMDFVVCYFWFSVSDFCVNFHNIFSTWSLTGKLWLLPIPDSLWPLSTALTPLPRLSARNTPSEGENDVDSCYLFPNKKFLQIPHDFVLQGRIQLQVQPRVRFFFFCSIVFCFF